MWSGEQPLYRPLNQFGWGVKIVMDGWTQICFGWGVKIVTNELMNDHFGWGVKIVTDEWMDEQMNEWRGGIQFYCTVLYSRVEYCTVQYSTVKY